MLKMAKELNQRGEVFGFCSNVLLTCLYVRYFDLFRIIRQVCDQTFNCDENIMIFMFCIIFIKNVSRCH